MTIEVGVFIIVDDEETVESVQIPIHRVLSNEPVVNLMDKLREYLTQTGVLANVG